jgi:hypothetical protein
MFDWDGQKDFLNVNAAVERCTSDMLFQPDYEQNLALVDKLQESPKLYDLESLCARFSVLILLTALSSISEWTRI